LRADGSIATRTTPKTEDDGRIVLAGGWTWRGRSDAAKEATAPGIAIAKRATAADWRIAMATGRYGRMRIALASRGFSLAAGSQLLALQEHYGMVLAWPKGDFYRILEPGTIRPLLDECRADVVPLVAGQGSEKGHGRRAGRKTRKWLVSSPIGEVDLEVAPLPEAPESGPLCRLFLELAGIHPSSKVCRRGEVALFASYRWRSADTLKSGNWFEVTQIVAAPAPAEPPIVIPPAGSRPNPRGLPRHRHALLLTSVQRAALRASGAASATFSRVRNGSPRALFLLLDGVPAAWVEPDREVMLGGLVPGRYAVQWRSFLGDVVSETTQQQLPGRLDYGVVAPPTARSAAPAGSAAPETGDAARDDQTRSP
jgi:hypothetical protein